MSSSDSGTGLETGCVRLPRHAKPEETDPAAALLDAPVILAPFAREWARRDDLGAQTVLMISQYRRLAAAGDLPPTPPERLPAVTRSDLGKVAEALAGYESDYPVSPR